MSFLLKIEDFQKLLLYCSSVSRFIYLHRRIYLLSYTHGFSNGLKEQMINSTDAVSSYENGLQALISEEKPHVRRELELPKDECNDQCVSS